MPAEAMLAPLIEVAESFPAATIHKMTPLLSNDSQGKQMQAFIEAASTVYIEDTELIRAAREGQIQVVEQLLASQQARINAQSRSGATALMVAAASGNKEIVRMLLAAGSDVNLCDLEGATALIRAVLGDRLEIAEMLIRAGAKIDALDVQKRGAIYYCRYCPRKKSQKSAQKNPKIDCILITQEV